MILVTNNLTGEIISIKAPEVINEMMEPVQSIEDRVNALEATTAEVVETLNDKGLIP